MKHTPGPWRWSQNPYGGARVETQSVGIADVLSRAGVPHPVQESCAANARLIAAAPELLEALERVERRARESGECPLCRQPPEVGCAPECPLTAARAAIAKATGGDHD